ncbi:MAG: hypothetical protein PHY45_12910 [Rhodocyclaceae bacterium]|nr:hypothetical protein [Rhodocyclaceae bacterium]
MVSDYRNRQQVELFLRNASAAELLEQRNLLQQRQDLAPTAIGEAERLIARIAYELRFRVAQPV